MLSELGGVCRADADVDMPRRCGMLRQVDLSEAQVEIGELRSNLVNQSYALKDLVNTKLRLQRQLRDVQTRLEQHADKHPALSAVSAEHGGACVGTGHPRGR